MIFLLIITALIAIGFIATLVRSTFGFGESLVAVPLYVLFLPPAFAVPLSVLMSILVAFVVVVQDHSRIHFYSAKWLILPAIPGIPLGLLILVSANTYWVKIGLGLLIIGYCIYTILAKDRLLLKEDSMVWLLTCGFLSGVMGGAYGLNGPPLVVYGNLRRWGAARFRATLQAYFLPASLLGLLGYAMKGLLTWMVFRDFLWSLPGIVPAIFVGRFFNHRLKGDGFYVYVSWGLILIGILLIVVTVL